MNSKNDSNSSNSYDFLEYNNIYDHLNPYFVNSFDITSELTNTKQTNKDTIKIVSNNDEIYFEHQGEVSARHQQIHDENKKTTSKSSYKNSSLAKKTSSSNTPKKVSNTYEEKKNEIRERLREKSYSNTAKSSSELTNREYNSTQYKSKPAIESYSSKKENKKNSSGCLFFFIFIFLFGSSIFSACANFLVESIGDYTDSKNIDAIFSSLDNNNDAQEIKYYEGDNSELMTIYEVDDLDNANPYYYDIDGNVYDENYALIENYEYLKFTQQTFANIKLLEITSAHAEDDGFITAFIEPGTYKVYYVINYTFYDTDNNAVDSTKINVPTNVSLKILDYHTNK